MAGPSVTYTFTNSTTADAGEINTNFSDLLNAMSDGTVDLSISALTCAGTVSLNGDINLGNGSTDDLTINASLASSILIKTTESYDIGSATLGLAGIYLGGNSETVRLIASASATATYTITLPVDAGVKGQVAQNSGSGALIWVPGQTDIKATGDAAYTILDNDGYRTIVTDTTMTAARTVTLPTAADNTDRIITIKKTDSGAFTLTVDGEGAETIDGAATMLLSSQYDSITVQSNGTNWHMIDNSIKNRWQTISGNSDEDVSGYDDVAVFTGLISGQRYKYTGTIVVQAQTGSDWSATVTIYNGSTAKTGNVRTGGGSTGKDPVTLSVIFDADDATTNIFLRVTETLNIHTFEFEGLLEELHNYAPESTVF